MGLHKICKHKGRARDRCKHAWWGSFRGKRVSLAKWTNREITSKAEADKALDELTAAIRDGTFDEQGLDPPPDNSPVTFGKFAEVYKQRHVLAKGLALSSTIDYRLKPLVERFGDRPVAEIKTADIDDFVADLKRPRVVNGLEGRRLTPASINRTLGLLRHMLNWAVGREYLDRTPFRRGTEVLKIPPDRASLEAKTPPRNPLQVTDSWQVGELACHPKLAQRQFGERRMVRVRGYAKGWNMKFGGIAA
jgi:hypothetical protein